MKKTVFSLLLGYLAVTTMFGQSRDSLILPPVPWDSINVTLEQLSQSPLNEQTQILADSMEHYVPLWYGEESKETANCYKALSIFYWNEEQFKQVEPFLLKNLKLYRLLEGDTSTTYLNTYQVLARLYRDMEYPSRCKTYVDVYKAKVDSVHGKQHFLYCKALKTDAMYYQLVGQYEKMEQTYLKTIDIYTELKATDGGGYWETIQNLAITYDQLGMYERAQRYYLDYQDYLERTKQTNTYNYMMNVRYIAYTYQAMEKYDKTKELLYKAAALSREGYGKENAYYQMDSLLSFVNFYLGVKDYETAIPLARADLVLRDSVYTKRHSYYANALNRLAVSLAGAGQYDAANSYFEEAEVVYLETLGEKHPQRFHNLSYWVDTKVAIDEVTFAQQLFYAINEHYLERLQLTYTTLSEREQLVFYNSMREVADKYYSYLWTVEVDRKLLVEAQAISLASKQLGLSMNRNTRLTTLTSSNPNLQQQYADLVRTRKAIAKNELYNQTISAQLTDSLRTVARLLEKQLAQSSQVLAQSLAQNNIKHDFTALQNRLQEQEAVVDFIAFDYYDGRDWTDTTYYAALLTLPTSDHPLWIPLAEEKHIQRILKARIKKDGTNYISDSFIGHDLYGLIWQPLMKHLSGVKTIHISPVGYLNQVAFAALPTDEMGEELLLDKYTIHSYGNLRDFIQINPLNPQSSIALFGGATFDLDSLELTAIAEQISLEQELQPLVVNDTNWSEEELLASRAIEDSTRALVEFNPLPGTLKEIEAIEKLLQPLGWSVSTYRGTTALEENLKGLVGTSAPNILHIATHGFFFPIYKKVKTGTLQDQLTQSKHPLMRSGLALTGANHVWSGKRPIEGLEDGVLTAYEIANLDLWNTDLVVLSACETGRGTIEIGEGVFGLQRAFKTAGVEQLIISLWKVPDAQTAELMRYFYEYYSDENTTATAFLKAQQRMRSKYAPYYWAGFVLIE